jgi:hypothetical protein
VITSFGTRKNSLTDLGEARPGVDRERKSFYSIAAEAQVGALTRAIMRACGLARESARRVWLWAAAVGAFLVGRESSDLEALEPIRGPPPIEHAARPTRAQRRAVGGFGLLLAAALGSTVAIAIGHITHGSGLANVASTATSTITVPSNFVSRVREPTRFDGWIIVVESYRLAPVFEQQAAPSGHKWLVAELTVTSTGGLAESSTRVASSGAISRVVPRPRCLRAGIPSGPRYRTKSFRWNWPSRCLRQIYSIVVRNDLESEKQVGTAVEIDLNCC